MTRVLTLTLFVVAACGGSSASKKTPDWVGKSCWKEKGGEYTLVYAVGRSTGPNSAIAQQRADSQAIAEVAKCVQPSGEVSMSLDASVIDHHYREDGIVLALATTKLGGPPVQVSPWEDGSTRLRARVQEVRKLIDFRTVDLEDERPRSWRGDPGLLIWAQDANGGRVTYYAIGISEDVSLDGVLSASDVAIENLRGYYGVANAGLLDFVLGEEGIVVLVGARQSGEMPEEPPLRVDYGPNGSAEQMSEAETAAITALADGQPKKALRDAKRCLKEEGEEGSRACPCMRLQGDAHAELGQKRLASATYKRFLDACPDSPDAEDVQASLED